MSIKKPTTADILVTNVDVQLLRKQRDAILNAGYMRIEAVEEHINGVLNLLDTMIDIAEESSQRDPKTALARMQAQRKDIGPYTALEVARRFVLENSPGGVVCPCCGRLVPKTEE